MRSYYEHIKQNNLTLLEKKPTFRASAIFPAYRSAEISTRYLFLGYWILKRNIPSLSCITTLREGKGTVLLRTQSTIQEPKGYEITLNSLLAMCSLTENNFMGSVEIEFFSSQPLIYPFPAVTINFYGKNFCSVVHTAQRIYNDYEDLMTNEKQHVGEGGFNIYANENQEPYLTIINGFKSKELFEISYLFINHRKETLTHKTLFEKFLPYETHFIFPAQFSDFSLKEFLDGKPGTLKLNFSLDWSFPRLIVGTWDRSIPALSVTHTYYDCSQATESTDYWLEAEAGSYPATLMLPIFISNDNFTNITFYPIYSPCSITLDLEVVDEQGTTIGTYENSISFENSTGEFISLNINNLCKNLPTSKSLALYLIAKSKDQSPIPARIKVSLDIGHTHKGIPSNICTNLIPYISASETKSTIFRWLPLLTSHENASCWIMNNTPLINPQEKTSLELTFYRNTDTSTLKRDTILPPKGFLEINPTTDPELRQFFEGTLGWCTVKSSNSYISTYYISNNSSGVVGGDHGY